LDAVQLEVDAIVEAGHVEAEKDPVAGCRQR